MNNDHRVWVAQVFGEALLLQDTHKVVILHIITKDIRLQVLEVLVDILADIEAQMAVLD
jgi:hypothetical protein